VDGILPDLETGIKLLRTCPLDPQQTGRELCLDVQYALRPATTAALEPTTIPSYLEMRFPLMSSPNRNHFH